MPIVMIFILGQVAALQVTDTTASCCAPDATDEDESPFGSGHYTEVERDELPADAVAASLGCGNPARLGTHPVPWLDR
jgi:hypothetical protein